MVVRVLNGVCIYEIGGGLGPSVGISGRFMLGFSWIIYGITIWMGFLGDISGNLSCFVAMCVYILS